MEESFGESRKSAARMQPSRERSSLRCLRAEQAMRMSSSRLRQLSFAKSRSRELKLLMFPMEEVERSNSPRSSFAREKCPLIEEEEVKRRGKG